MVTHAKHKKGFIPTVNTKEKALSNAYDLDLISDYPGDGIECTKTEQPKVEQPVRSDGLRSPGEPFEPKREQPEPPHISYIDQFAACKKRLVEIELELEISNKKVDELTIANSQLALWLKTALAEQERATVANTAKVAVTSRSV